MLLGFNGLMGAGKSEAINVLRESVGHLGRPVCLVKFAQPLYDIQEMIYERIDSVYTRPENFVKDRKLLQWLGTEWGRETISQSLWIDIWTAQVKQLQQFAESDRGPIIVCDDLRFQNEAERFKELGGTIVQIRTNRNHERIDTNTGMKNHQSEAGFAASLVTHVMENNGTLAEYREKLRDFYASMGIGHRVDFSSTG